MKTGRRIYFNKSDGEVIVSKGERGGDVAPATIEQDISTYKELSIRNRDSFDIVELKPGQYAQDFAESSGYRVNPETNELEFSYPDPNEPEIEQPYLAPLSKQIEELKQENKLLKAQNNATSERADFIEDIIAEMAMQVYQ